MRTKTFLVRSLLFIIIYSFFTVKGNSQANTYTIAASTISSNFSLTTAAQLEAEQQITNSFQITTESGRNYSVYLRVSSMTNTSGTPMPASLMAIQLYSSAASSRATPVATKIILSQTDQRILFDNNRSSNSTDSFNYNLFVGPVGYNYAPGNYTFNLLFTLTQP